MKQMTLKFKTELYPKEAVLKAAYHFLDKCYVRVDLDDCDYLVELMEKEDDPISEVALEFENELLAQTVRFQVYQQTHTIREILMARAMSSTITGAETEMQEGELPDSVDSLENILKDWFEKNEK